MQTNNPRKKAIVVHSGGMDSSICLALAIKEHGADNVLSISFCYNQRHSVELDAAKKICSDWRVDHIELNIDCLSQITQDALTNKALSITHEQGKPPSTMVIGRNGLMVRLASIHAHALGAHYVYTGIIEVEAANSGYRDCSRHYMDLLQQLLRLDFADEQFEIVTPVVYMTKLETMELADSLGVLPYLYQETISCYNGIAKQGCGECPACLLRNEGIQQFLERHPDYPPFARQ